MTTREDRGMKLGHREESESDEKEQGISISGEGWPGNHFGRMWS
jgi:hypothetical protein